MAEDVGRLKNGRVLVLCAYMNYCAGKGWCKLQAYRKNLFEKNLSRRIHKRVKRLSHARII